jgi:hypothetical protein
VRGIRFYLYPIDVCVRDDHGETLPAAFAERCETTLDRRRKRDRARLVWSRSLHPLSAPVAKPDRGFSRGSRQKYRPRSGRQDAPGVNFPGWGQDDLIPAGANAPRDKPGKRIESAARFAAWRRQADCWKEGRRLQTGDTVPSPSGILRRHPLHGAAPSAKERKTTNSEWQHDARSPNTGRRWARRGRRHRVHGDGMGRMYWLRFRKRRRCCVGQGTGHCDPASPHAIKRQNPDARFKSR